MTYTTNSPVSLEETAIVEALKLIEQWKADCSCGGKFCESFGCASLTEIESILRLTVIQEAK